MIPAWIALILNGLVLTLRLSGGEGGSFPRRLKAEEEQECLERMAAGDLEARNRLIEHNLRLVAHIVKKICHKGQMGPGKNGLKPAAPVSNRSPGRLACGRCHRRRPHGPRWC